MGESFRDRLRRLRRDPDEGALPEPTVVPEGADDDGLPDWFKDRLARNASEHPAAWRDRATGDPRDLQEAGWKMILERFARVAGQG